MSCSQCYTAQVPECVRLLGIYTSLIDITNDVTVVIKITDSHGNVYLIEGFYLDGMVSVDIASSSIPKNLLNRYAGTITLEVMNSVGVATMIICEKEYTCITLDVINNSASLLEYPIGCEI